MAEDRDPQPGLSVDLGARQEDPLGGSAGLAAQLVFWCGQAAFFAYLALYLQPGRGLDALEAGLVFAIAAVAYVAAAGATEKLAERHGRLVPLAGGLTLAAGHGLTSLVVADIGTGGSLAALVPGLLLIGIGMGLCITALNATVLSTLDDQGAGSASGVLATVQALGNSLGVAITGVIFFAAADEGFDAAFEISAAQLTVIGIAVAALATLLPGRPRDAQAAARPAA